MTNTIKMIIKPTFENLWSHHNNKNITDILKRLEILKMQGEYYQEINMPEVSIIIKGLMNDIEILKKEKLFLLKDNTKLKKG